MLIQQEAREESFFFFLFHGKMMEFCSEASSIIDFREYLLIAICCIVLLLGFTEIVKERASEIPYHGEQQIDNRYIV